MASVNRSQSQLVSVKDTSAEKAEEEGQQLKRNQSLPCLLEAEAVPDLTVTVPETPSQQSLSSQSSESDIFAVSDDSEYQYVEVISSTSASSSQESCSSLESDKSED